MVGMIKKEDVEKVRAAADLYDIVSATVTLKPSGTGTFVGLCPFHDEKTGSFNVRPSLGVWHCFGCGLGGDVFKYVEQSENIDFREAVELLADQVPYRAALREQRQWPGAREHRLQAHATAGSLRGSPALLRLPDLDQGSTARPQAAWRPQLLPS